MIPELYGKTILKLFERSMKNHLSIKICIHPICLIFFYISVDVIQRLSVFSNAEGFRKFLILG